MKVGLLCIATGRYGRFIDPLLDSVRRHFLPGAEVTCFLFTDAQYAGAGVERIAIEHAEWPLVTLRRYHHFHAHRARLAAMDFLFYSDIDMRFVADCDATLLPGAGERLVGVEHPGYYRRNTSRRARLSRWLQRRGLPGGLRCHVELPFERDPASRACLDDPDYGTYFAGGFQGGRSADYLAMAAELARDIDADLDAGVIATWHDESHLNRYFHDHPPKRLTPAYCYPESGYPHLRGLRPVLLALDKDHAALRAVA